jgi:hypothetical protein
MTKSGKHRASVSRMAQELGNARTLAFIGVAALIHAGILLATSIDFGWSSPKAVSDGTERASTAAVSPTSAKATANTATKPAALASVAKPASSPSAPPASALDKVMKTDVPSGGAAATKPAKEPDIDDLLKDPPH